MREASEPLAPRISPEPNLNEPWRRNLQRRPARPAAGRGRLQRQIARCFYAHGDIADSSKIYNWCAAWPADKRRSQAHRWSIRRILDVVADRIGRASTHGRPWIWRLRVADRVAKGEIVESEQS